MIGIESVIFDNEKLKDDKSLYQGFYYWQAWGTFKFKFKDGKEKLICTSDVAGGCGPISLFSYNFNNYESEIPYIKEMISYIIKMIVNKESPFKLGVNFITITQGSLNCHNGKLFRKMLKSLGFKETVSCHWRHDNGPNSNDFQSFFILDMSKYYLKNYSNDNKENYKELLKQYKSLKNTLI